MSKVNTEMFLARRISSRAGGPKNIMVRIATATVAVSMAVMIVALAVVFGFKHDITTKLTAFAGDVEIIYLDGNSSFETRPVIRNRVLEERFSELENFKSIFPYAVKGGIIKTDESMEGVMLKGVDGDYDWGFFSASLVDGALPVISDTSRTKDILISRTLAGRLLLGVDDRVEMLFVHGDRPPRRDRFKVSGIYNTGLQEMDRVMVLTDIRNVQRLNGWDTEQITGYEINTTDFSLIDNFEDDIYRTIVQADLPPGQTLMSISVKNKYPNLFDWLRAHDVNAVVIITIMVLVAFLNMLSALLIILLERTRMIGELKSMGMTNRSLRIMFLIRSSFIVIKGMIWGNAIGIGLCLIQKYTSVLKLDEAGYFLSEVPVQLDAVWLVMLNAGIFILLLVLLSLPASVVSRIQPEKTIRYQ